MARLTGKLLLPRPAVLAGLEMSQRLGTLRLTERSLVEPDEPGVREMSEPERLVASAGSPLTPSPDSLPMVHQAPEHIRHDHLLRPYSTPPS